MRILNKFTVIGAVLIGIAVIFGNFIFTISGQPLMEDSYIDKSNPDTNYGSSDELRVFAGGGAFGGTHLKEISLVKFNIEIPTVNTTINNAELQLTVLDRSTSQIYICANRIEEDWGQMTVTWNNQPLYDSQSDENCFSETMNFGSMISIGDTISFNVTESMQLWLFNPTMFPLYGFALVGYSQTNVIFQANTAKLMIDYTTIGDGQPPPQQNKTMKMDKNNTDTKDKDTGDKTDNDFLKDIPLWAWVAIGLGILLIFIGIIRKGG